MKTQRVTLIQGSIGSGKTTLAFEILKDTSYRRINRDEMRGMYGDESLAKDNFFEAEISSSLDVIMLTALNNDHSLVVDELNWKKQHIKELKKSIQDYCNETGKSIEFETRVVDACLETCLKQNKHRGDNGGRFVPEDIVREMHQKFQNGIRGGWIIDKVELLDPIDCSVEFDREFPLCIICNIDNTLALMGDRDPYDASDCHKDEVNKSVAATLKLYSKEGYKIILMSTRSDVFLKETIIWLYENDIPYDHLFMRGAFDFRKDTILKEDWLNKGIVGKYNVEFVMDTRDRVIKMWRSLGINTFQTNYGNF